MIKSLVTRALTVLFVTALIVACQEEKKQRINFPTTDLSKENLIPKPLKVIPTNTAFGLDRYTAIYTTLDTKGFSEVGQFLADKIKLN